ncbi:hypothetical protein H2198_009167 [Neophaeococcomyces mojaviensis]|uniref:Uncharacterized protein n=1 Tax=Neophaeococcomyces mojaviensis TaxID=3383035 RepID=A0ACC2ZV93_9EURO|nr:hypothetical protein H2198_009167 [Knufia sp. JES_112]
MPPPGDYHADAVALHKYVMSKDQLQLMNNPQAVLDAIDDYVNNVKHLMIYSDKKLNATEKALATLDLKPKVLVELGGYVGKSAVAWGPMLMKLNTATDSTSSIGIRESGESLRRLKEEGIEHIDVLFLDHWEKFYVPDLRLCEELSLLKPGSVIVADNTDMPGAPDYLKYVEGGGEGGWKYRCESIEVGGSTKGPSIVHIAYCEATP